MNENDNNKNKIEEEKIAEINKKIDEDLAFLKQYLKASMTKNNL